MTKQYNNKLNKIKIHAHNKDVSIFDVILLFIT